MRKVCHMTSAHQSDDVRIFYKECVSLAAAGYDTYLVAQGESREELGVHVVGVGEAPAGRLKKMLSFPKTVYQRALELDADVYHFHDPQLLTYGLKLKRRGKIVVFDSHENHPMQILYKGYLPVWVRRIASNVYRAAETFIVKRLDAVIVPSTVDGKNFFEGRAKRTCFVANYPRSEDFYGRYDESAERSGDVCYVGGLCYERGIYHLIKAVHKAGKRLVLAGEFFDGSFEQQVRAMPEFSCVDYLGLLPNTEVAKVLMKCRIGANTLLDVGQYHHIDTFGLKVFEYMSMGLPVILPDYPYMRRMAEKYEFGICVQTDDIDSIAQAIRYLSEHPHIAKQMGENGRKAIQSVFDWKTQEKVLIELYEQLLTV